MTSQPRDVYAVTLRDRFAMAALTGLLSGDIALSVNAETAANYAYGLADEMLKAREGER